MTLSTMKVVSESVKDRCSGRRTHMGTLACTAAALLMALPAYAASDPPTAQDYASEGRNAAFEYALTARTRPLSDLDFVDWKETWTVRAIDVQGNAACAHAGATPLRHTHYAEEYGTAPSIFDRHNYDDYLYNGSATVLYAASTVGNCYTYAFGPFGPFIGLNQTVGDGAAKGQLISFMSTDPHNYEKATGAAAVGYPHSPAGTVTSCTSAGNGHAWRVDVILEMSSWRHGQGSCIIVYNHTVDLEKRNNCSINYGNAYEWDDEFCWMPGTLWQAPIN